MSAKIIIEYLRDTDPKEYINTIKAILESSQFRFHVKTLILSTLALIQKPTEKEKQFVSATVLCNDELNDVFVNSVQSDGWSLFIIEEAYFSSSFIEKIEIAWQFFRKNVSYHPITTIRFLEELRDFENKPTFIENVLIYNNNWESPELLPYFEKYITYHADDDRRNLWCFDILEKIADHHLQYSFDKFRTILSEIYKKSFLNDQIDHHMSELIKKLDSKDRAMLFKVLLDVYNEAVEQTKYSGGYDKINCPYFLSSKLYPQLFSKGRNDTIEDYLLKYIIDLAGKKKAFTLFFNEHKDSDSLLLLSLIVEGLKENVEIYKNQVFELVQIVHSKNGFKAGDDNFQFAIRKLTGATFLHFSEIEKESVINIIDAVSSPYEEISIFSYPNKPQSKRIQNSVGKRKYLFLKSLPSNELKKFTNANRAFQELSRKFGPISDNKPLDASDGVFGRVTPPLPSKAYENMTLEAWRKSMIKFDEQYRGEFLSLKGGLEAHAKAFSDVVKQNPQRFANFINDLFEIQEISRIYILYGLEGLSDGGYDIHFTKTIFKRLLKANIESYHSYTLIARSSSFIDMNELDEDIFSYLKNIVLENAYKENKENESVNRRQSTVRNDAIHALVRCNQYQEYAEQIFQTIENVTIENDLSINVLVLGTLAYLNHLDINRAFNAFMQIVDTSDIEILKNSFWSAQYFNNEFHFEMYPYFEKIMEHEELHKSGNTLVISWLNDDINDKDLYDKFVKRSRAAKLCAIKIAEHNLFDSSNNIDEKCLSILFQFLNENEEDEKAEKDFAFAYSGLILRQFKDENLFPSVFKFLEEYSFSKHCKNSPAYFLEYLIKCSKLYPLDCLSLLKNIDFSTTPNIQHNGYYQKEPIELLLAIYSVLSRKPQFYGREIEGILDLFDKLTKHNHLREISNAAIEMILS